MTVTYRHGEQEAVPSSPLKVILSPVVTDMVERTEVESLDHRH